ncbi:MAG: catalase family protein [Proteobacteria bacterium]|nr:catalase family protein [Pseudomonadota bacterium]
MRFIKIILFIVVTIGFFLAYHFHSNSPVTTEEIFRTDEEAQTQRSIANFLRVVEENKTDYVARGAHSKGHACVKAFFDVDPKINPDLQHGVFSIPGKRYKSWIRFSNGASSVKGNNDANKDARGMAIKLFNIYDDKLIQAEGDSETQEFLMHDAPVFFTENIEDYNQFVESKNKILYFVSDINPFKWKLRELKHGLATLKEPPVSPLWNQYFSNTAYKLGPHNIKFSAQSCSLPETNPEQDKSDPDFLRKTMATELMTVEGCFNFMVQLQDPGKYMPIEDPSIEWKMSDSPYTSVATITIPSQEFDTPEQQAFCENLSFSPWNSLEEHRPIGELNRIRKAVYAASSKYRHTANKTTVPTNLDW